MPHFLTATESLERIKKNRPDLYASLKHPSPRVSLAWNVTTLRNKKQFSQVELAELAGVSRGTIISIENNNYNPTLDVIDGVAKAFGVTASDLIRPVDLTVNY